MDEPTIVVIAGDGLSKLLESPLSGRMIGDIDMEDAAAADLQSNEHVDRLEASCDNRKEVAGHESLGVIPDKGHPSLVLRSIRARRIDSEDLADSLVTDPDTALEEDLIGDSSHTPGHVAISHLLDELSNLVREQWSTTALAPSSPEHSKPRPVPSDQGSGRTMANECYQSKRVEGLAIALFAASSALCGFIPGSW